MRVYLMVDMEGIAGFVDWDNRTLAGDNYEEHQLRTRIRRFLTAEANAAIQGAYAGGATYVLVWDSHGPCNSIYFEDLHPDAEIIIGQIDRGGPAFYPLLDGSFDAAMYVGGHAMTGSRYAITPHTRHDLNGYDLGEVGMFMAMCGWFGVPVVMATGDQTTIHQVLPLAPQMEYVITKQAFSPYVARTLIPAKSAQHIRETAERAVRRAHTISPVKIEPPFVFRHEVGHRLVEFRGDDLGEVFARYLDGYSETGSRGYASQKTGRPERDKWLSPDYLSWRGRPEAPYPDPQSPSPLGARPAAT
jgi:D-amino peptidase